MSLTINDIITNLNSYIGDATTDRISAAERLQYVTESTIWLQESLLNDVQNVTHTINYYDTVHYYKVTNALADLLDGADLRRGEMDQVETAAHKSSREIAEEIGQRFCEFSWAIERHDKDSYLVINLHSKYSPQEVADCDSLTSGGGTWLADTVNSDATNLTIDVNEYKQGNASFNFDINVSQSANNKASIYNSTLGTLDLSSFVNLGAWVFWVYFPDVTYISSVTIYWGTDTSNYWSATTTTDYNGNAFVVGWNRLAIPWLGATQTNTPSSSSVSYLRIDFNYTSSQANNTDYRIDDIKMVRPEPLKFFYVSWNVGTDTTGVSITKFGATTDIPYFSGQYDQYKYAVAHKAASLVFATFRLYTDRDSELLEATRSLDRAKDIIPASRTPEQKSFKVRGVNLTRGHRRQRRLTF